MWCRGPVTLPIGALPMPNECTDSQPKNQAQNFAEQFDAAEDAGKNDAPIVPVSFRGKSLGDLFRQDIEDQRRRDLARVGRGGRP
jgi:hypothetical protein